jgi:hypothetical protein
MFVFEQEKQYLSTTYECICVKDNDQKVQIKKKTVFAFFVLKKAFCFGCLRMQTGNWANISTYANIIYQSA